MGTRADFYIGKGEGAEWLGSIAWDGYPDGIPENLLACTQEDVFRDFVTAFLSQRDDATFPSNGWPWPWETSNITDYAYTFDQGQVYVSCFGRPWKTVEEYEIAMGSDEQSDLYFSQERTEIFPNMKNIQNVRLDKGSGIIILGAKR